MKRRRHPVLNTLTIIENTNKKIVSLIQKRNENEFNGFLWGAIFYVLFEFIKRPHHVQKSIQCKYLENIVKRYSPFWPPSPSKRAVNGHTVPRSTHSLMCLISEREPNGVLVEQLYVPSVCVRVDFLISNKLTIRITFLCAYMGPCSL